MRRFAFVECASCAAKPGSPTLCAACLSNRAAIGAYERLLVIAGEYIAAGCTCRGEHDYARKGCKLNKAHEALRVAHARVALGIHPDDPDTSVRPERGAS